MTTPAAHIPVTPVAQRIRTPLLVSLVVGSLIAAALAFGLTTDDTAPPASSGATSVTTEDGLLDRIARSNAAVGASTAGATSTPTEEGLLDRIARANAAGATGDAAATSPAVTSEPTRAEVLERLYRINGVFPPEPAVPPTVR